MTNLKALPLAALLGLGAASVAFAAADKTTTDFVNAVVQADASEIMLGRQAIQNPTASPALKTYARMLVTDHTAHLQKAQALAKSVGVTPPDSPTAGADTESAKLHLLSGHAFDQEFAQYMVSAHQDAIALCQKEAATHDGAAARLASATLPKLREHLDAALKLEKR